MGAGELQRVQVSKWVQALQYPARLAPAVALGSKANMAHGWNKGVNREGLTKGVTKAHRSNKGGNRQGLTKGLIGGSTDELVDY